MSTCRPSDSAVLEAKYDPWLVSRCKCSGSRHKSIHGKCLPVPIFNDGLLKSATVWDPDGLPAAYPFGAIVFESSGMKDVSAGEFKIIHLLCINKQINTNGTWLEHTRGSCINTEYFLSGEQLP